MHVGEVDVQFLGHSGFLIKNSKVFVIDPYEISSSVPKADCILITHSHYDHCSIKDIQKIAKPGTVILGPPDIQSKISHVQDVVLHPLEVGDEAKIGNCKIEAVAAYNVKKEFHSKSEGWLGFVLSFKEAIIYHAGDTDVIPEMSKLTGHGKKGNTFVALLPVSGTYVMDSEEAAEAAILIKPDIAVPMHYGSDVAGTLEDAQYFAQLCEQKGINAKVLPRL